ncbi:hypothetical protein DFP72DRAFT_1072715 [Ephemerocybe angulata]|uniref:Retrotransposon gag domain-containing protein n=1 Tax=Ephemerocybe angulata TaxID=980116 RepID=A0A8H6HPR6_9AGAR|nr:hypothetical protein DFP72DRAFT_1072715 [Tulosesus angulatus]
MPEHSPVHLQAPESPRFAGPSRTTRTEERPSPEPDSEEEETNNAPVLLPGGPPQALGDPLIDATRVREYLVQEVILEIPTCMSTTTFARDGPDGFGSIAGRYYNVLKRAEEGLGRKLPSGAHLVNPEARDFFKAEYAMIDEILTHVQKYISDRGETGYRVNVERWKPLAGRMFEVRDTCKDAMAYAGEGSLDVPRWGKTGRMSDFWSLNDFEILSVAFRSECELFLSSVTRAVMAAVQHDAQKQKDEVVTEDRRRSEETKGKQVDPGERRTTTRAPTSSFEPVYPDHYNGVRPIEERSVSSRAREPPVRTSHNPFVSPQNTFHSRLTNPANFRPLGSLVNSPNRISASAGSTQRYREMLQPTYPDQNLQDSTENNFEPIEQDSRVRFDITAPGDPGDSSPDDSDGGKDHRKRGKRGSRKPRKDRATSDDKDRSKDEPKFDMRLKVDMIPTWDGNEDTLGIWITKMNSLSIQSKLIWTQLGRLAPTRLTGPAEQWYYSLHPNVRTTLEQNWDNLRGAISQYWMNQAFMEKQKLRANRATYRDTNHPKESPSEYFIRKLNLLQLSYDYHDRELIQEIMNGAPTTWTTIVTPHLYQHLEDFQANIKYHEDLLLRLEPPRTYFGNFGGNASRNPFRNSYRSNPTPARVNLVGSHDKLKPPQFPKDDENVSKRGTPESKGGRACRHCGSMKHWDYECKYARRGERQARVNFVEVAEDEAEAQAAYDDLFYGLDSEDEQDF